MTTPRPTIASAVFALCEALGYDPRQVTDLAVEPGRVTATVVVYDLNGLPECDADEVVTYDDERPWK